MLHEPKLLLLDEPTAGVDPKARRDFWDEIHASPREGITVLVSTHYMDEAERCHEIAYIAYGKLMARGTAAEIVRQSGLSAFIARGPGADRLAPKLRDARGRHRRRGVRRDAARLRHRPRRAASRAIEPFRHDATSTGRRPSRRSRTCSST